MTINYFKSCCILLSFAIFISCSSDETKNYSSIGINSRPSIPISTNEVQIGNQVWMTKNLNVSKYRNGDPIPQVADFSMWHSLTTGAWCYYENNSANGKIYGKLYNWYAVNDARGLAPIGYHVPNNAEWTTLITFLGGAGAGAKMKEAGTSHWQSPNTGATNSSGFTALPGGIRDYVPAFNFIGKNCYWWSSTEVIPGSTWFCYLQYNNVNIYGNTHLQGDGFSVRCLKD